MTEKDIPPSELNASNLKAKTSDVNLSIDPSEKDKDIPELSLNSGKQRKRSMVSLPSEGEEEEFMFSRLKKQIKSHWAKIRETYPNNSMLFKTSVTKEEKESETKEEEPDSTCTSNVNRSESINGSTSTLVSLSSIASVEQQLISCAIKSAFLLPNFSCKRDDEGRRCVPFISSLLQVSP